MTFPNFKNCAFCKKISEEQLTQWPLFGAKIRWDICLWTLSVLKTGLFCESKNACKRVNKKIQNTRNWSNFNSISPSRFVNIKRSFAFFRSSYEDRARTACIADPRKTKLNGKLKELTHS